MKKIFLIWVLIGFTFHLTVKATLSSIEGKISSSGKTELITEEFKVFPNPVVNKKFIIESFRQPLTEVRISNIAGKMVYHKKFTLPVQRLEVLTENYPDGIYLLRITTGGGASRTIKLLISTNR